MCPNCSRCNKAVILGCEMNEVPEWVGGGAGAYTFWDIFDSSDLIKAAHLSNFDPKFETHSLSHHLTNRSIIPTLFPFIR